MLDFGTQHHVAALGISCCISRRQKQVREQSASVVMDGG